VGPPGQCPELSIAAVSKSVSQISYPATTPIRHDGPVIEHAERPWGSYTVLAEGDHFKVKTIEVRPGQRLSYQRHGRRAEHWFVVAGRGVITLDGAIIKARPGGSVDIPRGAAHRIQNTGSVALVFVEVQHGDYFGEDDIVRLDDDYGATGSRGPVRRLTAFAGRQAELPPGGCLGVLH
jgi:mannose-6-phosphate isomerase